MKSSLSSQAWKLLLLLRRRRERPTVRAMAASFGVAVNTIVWHLSKLERAGLVVRPNNRNERVRLTRRGRSVRRDAAWR